MEIGYSKVKHKKYYVIGRARYKNFKLRKNGNVNLIQTLPLSFENFLKSLQTHNGGLTEENYEDLNANFNFGDDFDTPEENFEFGLHELWATAVQNYIQSGYTGFTADAHNLQLKEGGEFCYDVKLSRLMPKRIIDHREDPTKEQILYSLKYLLLQFYEKVPVLMENIFNVRIDEEESKEENLKKILKMVIAEEINIGNWKTIQKPNGVIKIKLRPEAEAEEEQAQEEEEQAEEEAEEEQAEEQGEEQGEEQQDEEDVFSLTQPRSPSIQRYQIEEESPSMYGGSKVKEVIRKVKGSKSINAFGRNEDLENLTWYNMRGSIVGLNKEPLYIRAHKYSKKMPDLITKLKKEHSVDKIAVWIPPKSVGRADGYFKDNDVDYPSIMPWLLAFEVKGAENYEEPLGGKTDKEKMQRIIYRALSKEKFKSNLIENEGLRGGILIYI